MVEEGGEKKADDWTAADDARSRALVDHAHRLGYWIRFYTLDGFQAADGQGWDDGYNFGSREAVLARWKAALAAGVNFVATDQYEELRTVMTRPSFQEKAEKPLAYAPPVRQSSSRCCPVHDFRSSPSVLLARGS